MLRKVGLVAVFCASALMPAVAEAQVGVYGNRFDLNVINNFYNSQPGVTSSIIAGSLTSASLTGISLLWAVQPAASYTASEITTFSEFLAGGGRIAFMGEHGGFAPSENNRISAAVAALGGSMSIVNELFDSGYRDATRAGGQILTNPLTVGVNTYNYAAFAPLTLTGTAQALMLGADLTSVMMGYQNVGPGSIFLITDQNVWDNVSQTGSNDNAVMFRNLLQANTGAPPVSSVPEPGSVLLVGAGLLGLAVARRRARVG